MQGCRIEVSAVGPNERVYFWIDNDLIKQRWIPQRAKKFARENRLEIDDLLAAVVERYAEDMRSDYFK